MYPSKYVPLSFSILLYSNIISITSFATPLAFKLLNTGSFTSHCVCTSVIPFSILLKLSLVSVLGSGSTILGNVCTTVSILYLTSPALAPVL